MSKKRIVRGIKRISATVLITVMMIGIGTIISKVWNFMRLPSEFHSSTAAYHAVYGDDQERLEILNEKAQEMGYQDFNDYRVRTW
jgi:hypothetical protein